MNPTLNFDVIVVGTGPTGLVLAHLLGNHGVRTLVIDKNDGPVDEARAVTIDDESLRTLQATGMLPEVLPNVVQGYGVHYYSWTNQLFAKIEPSSREYGYPKRNAFRQQLLVQALSQGMTRQASVSLHYGHELTRLEQHDDHVNATVLHEGQEHTYTARWLVACDGGRSTVRELLGITLEGSTYKEKWLIADLIGRASPFRHTRTYCDPQRPAIRLPGPQSTVRYEFMLHPGEDPEAVLEDTQLRSWIRGRDPQDAGLRLLRKVVYTFHARVATRWREGRVLLAGDAAHLTPPFAGQGMNSGVRDAVNLAWKLVANLQHGASPQLLESYQQERKPHAWALIQMALRIGAFMQPKSRLGAALAQTLLKVVCLVPAAHDYILHLKFKPKPRFFEGFFVPWNIPQAKIPSAQLMTQPLVELPNGQTLLLDDLLGTGYAVLQWADAPELPLPAGMQARVVRVIRHADDFLPATTAAHALCVRDVQHELAAVLDSAQAQAVVLRPDRYVMGYVGQDVAKACGTIAQAFHTVYPSQD
ncbi:bifunctional 3-(3-hydroxy-phenyl)propionate/3-hydroxycinnamic acid hydroxylase [Limnohabitans sp.]|uniref:bifunctional 3-(3-hydroxy-phenyl)propionate/3-hydroxycinnamic acid hydroxylase n=1 Tax=Limnohabitans sp. TaxID=1907725 RepID=UPI0038BC1471